MATPGGGGWRPQRGVHPPAKLGTSRPVRAAPSLPAPPKPAAGKAYTHPPRPPPAAVSGTVAPGPRAGVVPHRPALAAPPKLGGAPSAPVHALVPYVPPAAAKSAMGRFSHPPQPQIFG